jgi:hypothetical protein
MLFRSEQYDLAAPTDLGAAPSLYQTRDTLSNI